MLTPKRLGIFLTVTTLTTLVSQSTFGSPTQVVHMDSPTCDFLNIPFDVDELGSPTVPFPADELIDHVTVGQGMPVCFNTDDPTMVDPLVEIINLTARTFNEVWYVADFETRISNIDGFVQDAAVAASGFPIERPAFRIDNDLSDPLGAHHPLVFESNPNGVFDPGETWRFVLQDYSNFLGIAPDAFTSFGVGDGSVDIPGLFPSSGSIIAIPVPEPSALACMPMALTGLFFARRRRS